MKFRMFEKYGTGEKIAINVDRVSKVVDMGMGDGCAITMDDARNCVRVAESFAVVFSRLNTIAD